MFEFIAKFMLLIFAAVILQVIFEGIVSNKTFSLSTYNLTGWIIFSVYWLFVISGAIAVANKQWND